MAYAKKVRLIRTFVSIYFYFRGLKEIDRRFSRVYF
jgi:hypothetical protein